MTHKYYDNPLITRYASEDMSRLWSPQRKHSTWRRLWVALAEAQQELGLDIHDDQLAEMREHVDSIDFEEVARHERLVRHDVMAHVHTFGQDCPSARRIMHLGATSCFVTDNTDLILLREALQMVRQRLVAVIDRLGRFAMCCRDLACLGFTHLQPAQPTTMGKRACQWAYELVMDLEEIEHRLRLLKARSTKGTTGTQASFLKLFHGDHDKVRRLEHRVAEKMGFQATYPVTGQTYSRKIDSQVLDVLSGIAQSSHKIGCDLRLLSGRREIGEPFETDQIGSSAMPYKRNPMRSERICSLARFVISQQPGMAFTQATQWLERTLDDSAIRRLVLPQAFLATDALLLLLRNVVCGLVTYPRVIERNLNEELPFMATENILMAAVENGGDRQDLHDRIRRHCRGAAHAVNEQGKPNDLLERLAADEAFEGVDLESVMDVSQFVGRAPEQVDEFLRDVLAPIRERYGADIDDADTDVRV